MDDRASDLYDLRRSVFSPKGPYNCPIQGRLIHYEKTWDLPPQLQIRNGSHVSRRLMQVSTRIFPEVGVLKRPGCSGAIQAA